MDETVHKELDKRELVDMFQDILDRVWFRLASLAGEDGTTAIFRGSLVNVVQDYPFLKEIDVTEDGIRVVRLQSHLSTLDDRTIRDGFVSLLDQVIRLITDLTGDILPTKLAPLITQFNSQSVK